MNMSIGTLSLTLALPMSVYSALTSFLAGRQTSLTGAAHKSAHLVTLLVTITSLMLIFAFASDSFNIQYVYEYSSRATPFHYKLAGLWAGLAGSILFWAWLLTVYASLSLISAGPERSSYVNGVIQIVVIFFLLVLIFSSNPFTTIEPVPEDGRGLNPLLQNAFMTFHPPSLYLGYVGWTIPFAYAMAALLKGDLSFRPGTDWTKEIRIWTMIPWLFLTIGNILGGMWAYLELGWGGFWAWDPVENAAIIPWFTATAFLHSVIIQQKRGMLKLWNMILITLTFLLTIFGTFLTRSGVVQSVHSFSNSTIGAWFAGFLGMATLAALTLIIAKRKILKSERTIKNLFSREGLFCLNNILFIFALIAVLWGTMLPVFSDLLTGEKTEVGPPFFNRVMAPIGLALLFLTGIGPEVSWGKMPMKLIRREFLWPAIFGLIAGGIAFALGIRKYFPLLVAVGAVFTLGTILDEFVKGIRLVSKQQGNGSGEALRALFRRAPRRYSGYLVHLGVVLVFIGIAGSAYQEQYNITLEKGKTETAGGYELALEGFEFARHPESEGVFAAVSVKKKGQLIDVLRPALFLHKNQENPTAEVDLHIRPHQDVYVAMTSIDVQGGLATFNFIINPLILFVWIGGFTMVVGGVTSIVLTGRKKDQIQTLQGEMEMDVSLGRAAREDFRNGT